ncbi:diguanylate cyclase [Modestobacter sp. I12A-02628]|uniref:Diguanylate cyclase n=1 Tax=Goekera deserti TaxID=2497753 RepID=A0A7K3WIS3_9ACTN|nr:GGDEF domain-containing protein [Goekera deserti]MPQ97095.1 diguanylate cyclase [Goekera deserti]NDI46588.1 diguanylate cyclase [Goekera deserti]NEL56344.1 diguanylate cyclase [Goekera deserti]
MEDREATGVPGRALRDLRRADAVDDAVVHRLVAELDEIEGLPRADPTGAALRAVDVALQAHDLGLPELERRAQLVRADVLDRQGRVAEAGRIAQDVHAWAAQHGARYLQARSHHVLELVFSDLGDTAVALEHALHAVDLLDDRGSPAVRIDHLLRLADCLSKNGDHAAARRRFPDVLRLAGEVGDVSRVLLVLNNWAYAETVAGHHERALRLSEQLQASADRHGVPLGLGERDTVARALMGLGRWEEAEELLAAALVPEPPDRAPEPDMLGETLLTLAQVRRARGRSAEAQQTLDECVRTCEENGLSGVRVRAREEQAQLHAAGGRYREAYEEHRRFHAETTELRSLERDARARTLQAVYETSEAQRESRAYRELSLRDSLTGLYNRRHVEQEVQPTLHRSADRGRAVTVALLDLDHFKQVNDRCSHGVGDQVLQVVAEHLARAAEQTGRAGSFAARMGGEEFLLVLVGPAHESAAQLERVRRTVSGHPWGPLTGEVPVTVSIGAVVVVPGGPLPDLPTLLRLADQRLYRAKSLGRDRVVVDAG